MPESDCCPLWCDPDCPNYVRAPKTATEPRCSGELCESCGGHGALMRDADPETDTLTDRERKRLAHGRLVFRSVPCPNPRCCGHDHVTPLLESQAESAEW